MAQPIKPRRRRKWWVSTPEWRAALSRQQNVSAERRRPRPEEDAGAWLRRHKRYQERAKRLLAQGKGDQIRPT